MSRIAIFFGLLLCTVTLAALIASMQKIPAQFCPMMLGIPMLFCGVVGLNPHRRKHAMHVAAAIALLGTLMGGSNTLFTLFRLLRGIEVNPLGMRIVMVMTVLCVVYLVLSIVSFIQTRRRRLTAS
ncbi:hypothetical protein Pla52o_41820 [Novipirellula galeiformis]|uniref:Uncharacterized protein n=1 Tax=Novipirellula galeiformis TaxID=2528004 RepID=A0A5C6CAC0_9BACT|nr:hypothetical protein [Novipirellula galeiformis]TWU21148.1 hypothetical protein Pla52o_41820 [Novipirellula galeiformis]